MMIWTLNLPRYCHWQRGVETVIIPKTIEGFMSPDEQQNVVCFWNAFVFAGALYSFGYGLLFSSFISAVILISTLIGYGRRYLVRAGFALMVIAMGVAVGMLPPPEQWSSLSKSALTTISRAK